MTGREEPAGNERIPEITANPNPRHGDTWPARTGHASQPTTRGVGMERRSTPLQAIRRQCAACMCGQSDLVRECPSTSCPLHDYRQGDRLAGGEHHPLQAIRAMCLQCANGRAAVATCAGRMRDGSTCPLHYYRSGRVPHRQGRGNVANLRFAV